MDRVHRIPSDDLVPAEVEDLVRLAQRSVAEVIGVEPDLTPETLPLVDEYLRQLPVDISDEVLDLVLSSVGCYFGEVVRRKLHGRWITSGFAPETWRVELINCFLHFHPVGMAGEVYEGAETDEHDGGFATMDELWDGLEQMLAQAAPVTEEEYYSLAGRIDILQLAADWLVGRTLATGKQPRSFSAEEYRLRIDIESGEG
jgi:hypothetical protein